MIDPAVHYRVVLDDRSRSKVLIFHPEYQHSHRLAEALSERNFLGSYFHGATLPEDSYHKIDPAALKRNYWYQPIRRSLPYVVPKFARSATFHSLLATFDYAAARKLARSGCQAVIAYENSALHTFRTAKNLGIGCILDAASYHHSWVQRWLPDQFDRAVAQRKNLEIELADLILTCSHAARNSYVEAGVDPRKVRAVALGADIARFCMQSGELKKSGPVRFAFAGFIGRRKGIAVLAAACESLAARGVPFELSLAGGYTGEDAELVKSIAAHGRLLGRVPTAGLNAFYWQHDVFILPSLFDSFGMVVREAMACGLPAIVSVNVGAGDIITEGVNGWVIPVNDVEALADRMAWCAAHPAEVRAMAPAARAAAEARDWETYRNEVASVVGDFLAGRYDSTHSCAKPAD